MNTQLDRPNPDDLLARVQADEAQQTRGKLNLFLGYAAGVGKTYAMLEGAQQRRMEGVDVVVGYVETHGRADTEVLLEGLEVIPRRQVEYRGTVLGEMDLDAVLARHPQLALVDEFAHTNVPGSRHPKRYLDIEELLGAGIDVYTTLNIQHLESLNDVVAQITGVIVHETVPDRVLDEAAEIKVVDLPPEELQERMREGKVYVSDQAARAIARFFRLGNLTALREMTLRRAAERVDAQMRAYMVTRSIPGPWSAGERLLVCVSSSSLGERLVRAARHLADELKAEWFAVYVETAEDPRLGSERRDRVARTLHLAEELGAKALTLPGQSVPGTVLAFARSHNISKIIAGKPLRARWQDLLQGSIVDQLVRSSGLIDVYVISGEPQPPSALQETRAWLPHRPLRRYLFSLLIVAAATLISLPIATLISPTNLVMVYLVAVVVAAVYLGRGPSILASVISVLAFDYFFIPPQLTFHVAQAEYILTFVGFFVVSQVISVLAIQARRQSEAARRREAQTAELYDLTRDLATTYGLEGILKVVLEHLDQTFHRKSCILVAEPGGLAPRGSTGGLTLGETELAVADWVYRHGEPAGLGTDTLPAADLRYLPLKTARGVVGVLGLKGPDPPQRYLTSEQQRLMEAFASQAAQAIERAQLVDSAHEAELLQATEKLQNALLNSISHDLRTPLVAITGALSTLTETPTPVALSTQRALAENALEEAERLNRLVGNLLDMTRLEAGAMKLAQEPSDVQDVVGAALDQLGNRLSIRPVTVDVPAELPLVPMDFVLIVQVLVNVLDNALKYSPTEAPIEIHARAIGPWLEVQVADRGIGIPSEDLGRVFDKFYRVHRPESVTGTGLGLSICKGIVEAHGGSISAQNREGGGMLITFTLPLRTSLPVSAKAA
ncbi:MAG: sensor histidine kinase KdpD [Anaerolineales bacterium]|jgi:two-component system sensor histidine kinase KdpD